jgi:hypothetical protein
MNHQNGKTPADLRVRRQNLREKVTELNDWLLNHFEHNDRPKKKDERTACLFEINLIDKKLANINAGLPENGYAIGTDHNYLNRQTINNTQI